LVPVTQLADLNGLLSLDEQDRAQRFRFDRHRRRFIVARSTLRQILGRYTGKDPRRLVFGLGPYGKPFLTGKTNAPDMEFNVTHSGDLALMAFSLDRRVGIDVEQIRVVADAETIAKRYFSPGEHASLLALDAGKRQRCFLNCWTRKEAFIKAIGEGLTFPLDSFQVSLDDQKPAQLLWLKGVPDPAQQWLLHAFEPEEGYVAALACEGTPKGIDGYRFQPLGS
jgi:4'-phosphopantetheinyl transferase